ncbi:hypothetical protein SAMN05421768_105346 [Chryseobacterium joostei]|uniref:DUF1737 domain-containing protein n=1 Tax=Chryseobacterium joostei TaxID=112234 RepID=A0A1N7IHF0_9FLAO|nr:hypothetical protein [Chryseobacterium joostei]SIS36517.1 hypothetical protein SAMN05421768_105346 [Chryseobacterium joostei]
MKTIKVIRDTNLKDFETEINKHFSNGWMLKGNLCIDSDNFLVQMLQKKIKK